MRHLLCLLALLLPSVGLAQPVFDVAQLHERSTLTPYLSWYRDDSGEASLATVRTLHTQGRFTQAHEDLAFGFTQAVHWIAFSVVGHDAPHTPWILQLSYPLIDDLTLYRVLPDGRVEQVATGDMRPYSARARPSVDFTFEEHSAREPTQYFLRAQTTGALRLPLYAWQPDALRAAEIREERLSFLFLGGMAVIALYNLGVYLLLRQLDYLIYVGVLGTQTLAWLSFAGLLPVLLLPDQPQLVNRALSFSLAGCLLFVAAFATIVLGRFTELARETRSIRVTIPLCALVLAFSVVAPLAWALRASVALSAGMAVLGSVLLVALHRKHVPGVRLHVQGWLCVIAGLSLQMLASRHVLPSFFLTEWGAGIGCMLQAIVVALALAQQVNLIRERLATNVTQLEDALAQAERATRVKDEFVATMSHELRTPLNAIINIPAALLEKFAAAPGARCEACGDEFALDEGEQLLAEAPCPSCRAPRLAAHAVTQYTGDPAQARHYLALAERCGKHLLQMVNGVLDYSKIAAGKFELQLAPADPLQLLREACESMQAAAKQKEVRLHLELPSATPRPTALDELRIRQVLFNLLSNAIKFSPAGGEITVSAHEREHAFEIAVCDQGIGIATQHHERIFSGFEQVHSGDHRKYGGTGLGLSISRSLVRMHGGELWVESALGHGSTFHVRLPRDAALPRDDVANDTVAHAS